MSDKISDKELLDELKRLKKVLGRNPKQRDLKLGNYSCNAYKRAFGGISPALILIGEEPTFYKNLTKEDLVNEIKRIYKETGEVPTYTIFCEKAKFTYQTARNILDKMPWHLFLKECNLFTDEQLSKVLIGCYTAEELKNEVLRLKEKYGRCPCYHEMSMEGNIAPIRYAYKYGSYSKAMVALGFDDFIPRGSFQNSTPIKGKDGNFYKSIFEANVAHYLLDLKNNNLIASCQ